MTKDEKAILHDIIIDLRKTLIRESKEELRLAVVDQVNRLYRFMNNSYVTKS